MLDETERNLRNKSPLGLAGYAEFLTADIFKIVQPSAASVDNVAKAFEQKDAPIIAGAIAAQAGYLATYDRKHLLSQYERIYALHTIVVYTPELVLREL